MERLKTLEEMPGHCPTSLRKWRVWKRPPKACWTGKKSVVHRIGWMLMNYVTISHPTLFHKNHKQYENKQMNQVPVCDSRKIATKWKWQILERPINKGVLGDFSVCFRFWRSRVWIPAGSRGIGEANPYLENHLIIENHLSKKSRAQSLYLGELRHLFREAMHHPKTL